MKNLSIMGGMLYAMVYGPGPLALGGDSRASETGGGRDAGKKS
jgi:uncharacterized membrane protein YphA (DoxX/SURF4 family)